MTHDLIIIGAGPAGASAAIAAAGLGLRAVVLDEQHAAGGQVWRAPSAADAPDDDGARLRHRLRGSGATCAFGRRVWSVERGFTVSALGVDGAEDYRAPALIVATGAYERHVPVPGWTLPGVIGLAAATILLKSQQVLPGRRVVVAGVGPLLLLVAAEILHSGGKVAAVIDANRRRDWLAAPSALLSRPDLAGRGIGWLARLLRAGVPVLSGHALRRIDGADSVTHVIAGPIHHDGTPAVGTDRGFDCDAVCLGYGLQSSTEVTRLLGARHAYQAGSWVPLTMEDQRTTVLGLYACGDGAGVQGVAAAPLRGEIAAIAAARDLGRLTAAQAAPRLAALQTHLRRAARFGDAMAALATPPSKLAAAMPPETIVCRCERVSRIVLDEAIVQGAVTVNDLKSATRCGMGPCGGRMCEYAAAQLIAARTGYSPEEIGPSTARPPLRPVTLQALAGDFDYDSLPMIEPAPL
jgi:thioredoxin reductase/bacterioferritin-associated ferredoxin